MIVFKFIYTILLITLCIFSSFFMLFLLVIEAYLASIAMAVIVLVFIFEIIRTIYYNPM